MRLDEIRREDGNVFAALRQRAIDGRLATILVWWDEKAPRQDRAAAVVKARRKVRQFIRDNS